MTSLVSLVLLVMLFLLNITNDMLLDSKRANTVVLALLIVLELSSLFLPLRG
jgi:hypothetical protein